jgi:hypothetical protein
VLFNLGAKRARFDLPLEGGTWTDLLTGKTMQAASKGKPTKIYAGPMRSYILKKETNVNKIM